MRKMLMIMAVLAMVAVVLVPACAQQGRRGRRGGGQMSEAERAQMREQMIERMLEQAGLTDDEKAAAKAALIAKQEARRVLAEELAKLRAVAADDAGATDEELQEALTAYRAAMTQYHDTIEAQDAALVEQLSLQSEVRCMLLGILQNGVGMRGGMRGPDGGGRGRGDGGGGGRGGQ